MHADTWQAITDRLIQHRRLLHMAGMLTQGRIIKDRLIQGRQVDTGHAG